MMRLSVTRYILMLLIAFQILALTCAIGSEPDKGNPFLEFEHHGESHTVHKKQITPDSFVFNRGAPKKINIVTLDWPPYIGKDICRQGWVQQFAVAMLATQGYEITTTFLPWARAVAMAETGHAHILYPEYLIEKTAPSDVIPGTRRVDHLALSHSFPGGQIAFMTRKGNRYSFNGSLLSLKGEKIGVVRGYQNTPAFDTLMDQGFFEISTAADDLSNVQMLVAGRINLIIGDPAVIFYHLSNPEIENMPQSSMLSKIEVVKPLLQYKHLYFAISKKKPAYKRILHEINTGIQEFTETGLIFDIIRSVNTRCGFHMPQTIQDKQPRPGKVKSSE